jgi:hypothetical protein
MRGRCVRTKLAVVTSMSATTAALLGCSPPAECTTLLEARDQDRVTIDAVASLKDSVDAKKSAETSKAFRDAAKKLDANAARIAQLKPSDLGLAKYSASYVTASKAIVTTLTALGNQFEKLSFAQEKFANAQDHVAAARAKIATACKAPPAPAGCAEIVGTLVAAPIDEGMRKQIVRDMESVKLGDAIVPLRTETIAALREMDAARKEIDAVGIEAQASISATALSQAGGDIEKACGRKGGS